MLFPFCVCLLSAVYFLFTIKALLNADCQVFKFKRSDTNDHCPEIPDHIKVQPLTDSQEFAVDGAKVRIVHTPGHTTDHVVLTTDDGTLFSGDCILGELLSSNSLKTYCNNTYCR